MKINEKYDKINDFQEKLEEKYEKLEKHEKINDFQEKIEIKSPVFRENSNFQRNSSFFKEEREENAINSEEKRVKAQTFLESTFNTKIARKLTMESKKSLEKKQNFKGNEKKLLNVKKSAFL